MADAIRSSKPKPDRAAKPPDTARQTGKVEQVLTPQHNTTEPYGKSSEEASRKTR